MLDTFGILSILLLVGANAYFVAAEYALVTVRWTRIEELTGRGNYAAAAVRWAIEHKDETIAATQLGVTLASLGLGWIGEPVVARDLTPLMRALPVPWSAVVAHGVAIALAFLAITYLHVVLGELAPKAVALQRTETVALIFIPPLLVFARITRPLVVIMRASGAFVVRLMRVPPPSAEQAVHSVEELDMLVEETKEAGVIPPDQASYLQNVFELSDKMVRDVMVPRDRVVTISLQASEEEVLETARETAHTRLPVWEGDPNNIVGIVNPAPFVEPETAVSRVLLRLRREKRAMAVVRSRAGQFLGIVTLEDILEEIVGEIEDEHDIPEPSEAQPT